MNALIAVMASDIVPWVSMLVSGALIPVGLRIAGAINQLSERTARIEERLDIGVGTHTRMDADLIRIQAEIRRLDAEVIRIRAIVEMRD